MLLNCYLKDVWLLFLTTHAVLYRLCHCPSLVQIVVASHEVNYACLVYHMVSQKLVEWTFSYSQRLQQWKTTWEHNDSFFDRNENKCKKIKDENVWNECIIFISNFSVLILYFCFTLSQENTCSRNINSNPNILL